jgi:excisionase family DNA binding protein
MSTTIEKRVYNLHEAGVYIDASLSTIYNLINSGELRSVRIGRRHAMLKEDLDKFIDSRVGKPPAVGTGS